MEGGAAGGRGSAGGARGKSKKARARAKAAAASAAAASAASAAPAKQSAGKKSAAVDGAQTPAAAKTKALKAAKAGRAAAAAGVQTATAAGTGVATRLTRKKVAGTKSVAKLTMGTVAAAAAVAVAASAAPKKRAAAKKKQQQQVLEVVAVPAAAVDTAAHVHSAAKMSELATSRAHEAAATSTVVSLTGGKRARGKKRRAGSIGASDHESSASAVATESAAAAAATPTPAAAAEHETPAHAVHPHHIVDLNKHSPSSEPRIVFLGGAAARDNAKQDLGTGATGHSQVPPLALTPHDDNPKSTASPTTRVKKAKVVKKIPIRAKTVGSSSDASKKTQATKAGESKMTTRLQKKTAESQVQPGTTESDPSAALSALAAAATTHHTVVASSSPLANASRGAVTRSHDAQALTDAVGSAVGGEYDKAADAPKQGAKVVTEASSETSGSTSGVVASAPSVKSPIREMLSAPPHLQLTQQQLEQSRAGSSSTTMLETEPELVPDAQTIPTPVVATLRSNLAPVQPPTTSSKSSEVDAPPPIASSVDRSGSKEEEAITTTVQMSVELSAPVPPSKSGATKKEPPSQVSSEAPTAQVEHANSMEQESTINAQKSGLPLVELPLVEDFPPLSLPPVEEVIKEHTPDPVPPPSATHPDATPTVPSNLPRVTIPEAVLSEKDPRDGEDGGDGVTSPATQALRRIFSGEMKRLRAVQFERLSAITEHPTSEPKPMTKTSKKRRREDDSADNETSQLQTVATLHPTVPGHRPTARKPAPREPPRFGIIMDSHAYVDKMMRSDPVANPTPTNQESVRQQPPVALPSNSWGASFGFAGGAAVSNLSVPSSPRSPLASTRPLSSWFLSKGAANFVKRVSFKHEASAFGSPEPSKRRRVSVAAEDGTSSRAACSGGESDENAFLASLASKASWRSWYTSDDKKPAASLLDSIPASRVPRELLDHPIEPMALEDGGESASLPSTDATTTTGPSMTTATSAGRVSELERLEQEIRWVLALRGLCIRSHGRASQLVVDVQGGEAAGTGVRAHAAAGAAGQGRVWPRV